MTASLVSRFAEARAAYPEKVVVRSGERELTYAQLDTAAEALAASLAECGVRRGDLVGLQVRRSAEVPVGILGILKAGAAYVPLDPTYPADRLRHMACDAGIAALVGDDPDAAEPYGLTADRVVPVRFDVAAPACTPVTIDGDDAAYVIFTSGSTGRPKGCVVTHGNVLALMDAALPLLDVGEADRWTLFHSISFDISVWELWGTLLTGATLVVVPTEAAAYADRFLDLLVTERITVLNQVPSVFRSLVQIAGAKRGDLALRYVIFAGEAVNLDVIAEFLRGLDPDRTPKVINMYGITETTVHVTYKEIGAADLIGPSRSPIGHPLPHLRVEVRGPSGRPVPAGQPGEMWVAGLGVARGYLNRPELTAARFVTRDGVRYYRSGDLGRYLDSGELEYLGRNDQQVKFNGFRIELGEIESALRDHTDIADAAAVVAPLPDAGAQVLVACVLADPAFTAATARAHLAQVLPAHMIPGRFLRVSALPLTRSGKLDRAALAALVDTALRR